MIEFKDEVVKAVKSAGWDGQDDIDETKLQWSFAGALLYAVTVITTIGRLNLIIVLSQVSYSAI